MTADHLARLRSLSTPLVSDALDALGRRAQALQPGFIRLAGPAMVVGRAATMNVTAVGQPPPEPYRIQFLAVDDLGPESVMVVAAPSIATAFWGELITTKAQENGCVAVIVDGYCRDVAEIRERGTFGVWAKGAHPSDSLGRLDAVSWNEPVVVGGVTISAGDYVVADVNGVVIVPTELVDDVLRLAEEKQQTEHQVRDRLRSGSTIVDTFDEYGVM